MINGILNVYKEKGYTSHDVVAKLRGIFRQKKIGHTGTLDPDAQGVLPVCLGNATKLCDLLTDRDKTYRAVLLLGKVTDTQDISGEVLSESAEIPQEDAVRRVAESFVGEYDQIPPMYSALKVGGKKLYELAREGKTVERPARRVTIYEIVIEKIELPRVTMTVSCSKGTYIRTLCQDIGQKLGCGGCMEELLRIRAGAFLLEESRTLAQIEELQAAGRLEEILTAPDQMFAKYPACHTTADTDKMLYNGNSLFWGQVEFETAGPDKMQIQKAAGAAETDPQHLQDGAQARVYDSAGVFCGLYRYRKEKKGFWPVKMFLQ